MRARPLPPPGSALALALLGLAACVTARPAPAYAPVPAPSGVEQIRLDAEALRPQVHGALARDFLAAAGALPREAPRPLFRTADQRRFFTAAEAAALSEAERAALVAVPVDEELYYNTKYGSPLAYARALEVLGEAGLEAEPGARLLDFGYGGIGQLRLLASLGFEATGVDVDPFLRALYSAPSDQGRFGRGQVRLLDGRFPADEPVRQAVGTGYAVIVSKNVLKKGYVHPDRPAEERRLIHLGVEDAVFLRSLFEALRPGGLLLLYNICPALSPPDKPFVPWSDGRSPFSEQQLREAGFEVLAFDRDDTPAIRALGHTLAWDRGEGAMDLEHDLSVLYTLVRKPR
jgi:SAM-dependent methyltransferase